MPEKKTRERAQRAKRAGKAPTTQAGAYVREEVEHVREGKHGARSPQQAIAVGLSKARRSGIELRPPAKGRTSERTRKQAKRDMAKGRQGGTTTARKGASKRTAAERSAAARKGARKRTASQRSAAAQKGARKRTTTDRKSVV